MKKDDTFQDKTRELQKQVDDADRDFWAIKEYGDKQQQKINELKSILKDFLTTRECPRTWVDEMRSTIADVLGED